MQVRIHGPYIQNIMRYRCSRSIEIIACLASMLFSFDALCGVIVLNSGQEISGTITTKTENYLVIDTGDETRTFYNDEIASIRGRKPSAVRSSAPQAATIAQALHMASQGQFLHAEEAFRQILEREPLSLSSRKAIEIINDVRNGLITHEYALVLFEGASYFYNHEFQQALDVYTQALTLYPDAFELYYNIAHSYLVLGEIDEAIVYFKKLLEYNPDDRDALYSLAIAYQSQEDHDQAIYYLKRIVTAFPSSAQAWFLLGSSYVAVGDMQQGRDALQNAKAIYEQHGNQEKLVAVNRLLADITP